MSIPSLVLDASVALAWAFEDEASAYTDFVLESLAEVKGFVPIIWPLEVGNALLIAERRKRLNQAATVQFLALLWQLPIMVETERPGRQRSRMPTPCPRGNPESALWSAPCRSSWP